jgi:hypothetical protein
MLGCFILPQSTEPAPALAVLSLRTLAGPRARRRPPVWLLARVTTTPWAEDAIPNIITCDKIYEALQIFRVIRCFARLGSRWTTTRLVSGLGAPGGVPSSQYTEPSCF